MNDREAKIREAEVEDEERRKAYIAHVEKIGSIPFPLCTVTFYSFKGGVGRTLALLNVATLLAKLGNRVVIADFDLEAPGLDTYKGFEPPTDDQPGILEFVTDYTQSKTLSAPSCKDYLYCVFDKGLHRSQNKNFGPEPKENPYFGSITGNGALYVMRAGRQDSAYRENLAKLNWDKLFAEQDGHLLFANLKNELFEDYGCTFLLLDSRTGLNDVAGVCTAFLPDAVVLMFYPDKQNTRGINTVANAIQNFEHDERRRIPKMYCVSRVPNMVEVRDKALELAEDVYLFLDFGPARVFHGAPTDEEISHFKKKWNDRSSCWEWDKYILDIRRDGEYSFEHRYRLIYSGLAGKPHYNFGGVRVCQIPEYPSVTQELAARRGHQHNDCKPYMSLVSFSASNNVFERFRLEIVTGAALNLDIGERRNDLGDGVIEEHIREDLRYNWLTAQYFPFARESSRRQVEYARKWHPDIEPIEEH